MQESSNQDAVVEALLEQTIGEAFEASQAAVPQSIGNVLKFFAFAHLPPKLKAVSIQFCDLACRVATGSSNAETTVALRKLLEAKDAAVRAVL